MLKNKRQTDCILINQLSKIEAMSILWLCSRAYQTGLTYEESETAIEILSSERR